MFHRALFTFGPFVIVIGSCLQMAEVVSRGVAAIVCLIGLVMMIAGIFLRNESERKEREALDKSLDAEDELRHLLLMIRETDDGKALENLSDAGARLVSESKRIIRENGYPNHWRTGTRGSR